MLFSRQVEIELPLLQALVELGGEDVHATSTRSLLSDSLSSPQKNRKSVWKTIRQLGRWSNLV